MAALGVLSAWGILHSSYALHYAYQYYRFRTPLPPYTGPDPGATVAQRPLTVGGLRWCVGTRPDDIGDPREP